ncbi:auxilin-related protein 1 [Senna tora]|uniref:Auxilin-related protein 1 n=1 Tax=Senna tora TaxID=362788 RepID=A0A834T068_9FABA|nr:auxilin-related protein 1 [Senna tora]
MKTSSFSLPSNHLLSPPSSTVTLAVLITDVLMSIACLSNTSVVPPEDSTLCLLCQYFTDRLTPSPTLSDLYRDRAFAPSAPKLKFFLSCSCLGVSCHSVFVSDGSYPLCPSLAVNLVSSSYPTILRTIDLRLRSLLLLHRSHRNRIAETADIQIKQWAAGNESNMRALLSTLQYVQSFTAFIANTLALWGSKIHAFFVVLWAECGWQPVSLTDMITSASVKKVYRKATLCIHPNKVQQKGASLEQSHLRMPSID